MDNHNLVDPCLSHDSLSPLSVDVATKFTTCARVCEGLFEPYRLEEVGELKFELD